MLDRAIVNVGGIVVQGRNEEWAANGRISCGAKRSGDHFVQLYGSDTSSLSNNVARFFAEGYRNGDGLLLIANAENTYTILDALKTLALDPDLIRSSGRFVVLDAERTLRSFMHEGQPDRRGFFETIVPVVQQLVSKSPSGEMSAYGEMVGVLWTLGSFSGAMALEDMWNDLLSSRSSRLFCGYPIDVFGASFHACDVEALLSSHSHMIPVDADEKLETAICHAIGEVLGNGSKAVQVRDEAEQQLPWAMNLRAEAAILWVRKHLGDEADDILARARQYCLPQAPIDYPASY
jgi:hypothetical protein